MKRYFKVTHSIVIELQQERMRRYRRTIAMATTLKERKLLLAAYEVSRLIHIKDEDVIERSSWLLQPQHKDRTDG